MIKNPNSRTTLTRNRSSLWAGNTHYVRENALHAFRPIKRSSLKSFLYTGYRAPHGQNRLTAFSCPVLHRHSGRCICPSGQRARNAPQKVPKTSSAHAAATLRMGLPRLCLARRILRGCARRLFRPSGRRVFRTCRKRFVAA